MNELPEGIFEMPSFSSRYRYQWDQLLEKCLQSLPAKRVNFLGELLKEICQDSKPQVTKVQGLSLDESITLANEIISPIEEVKNENQEKLASASFEVIEEPKLVQEEAVSTLRPILQNPLLERPQTDPDPAAIFQVNSAVKVYNPERKDVTNIKPILTDMIVIEGGSFYRGSQDGSRDEMPRHQITLISFALDIHPVTNEQFVRFLEVMGGEKDSNHNDIIRLRDSRIKRSGGKLSIESGYAKHPVVGVTWYGAVAYAKWIGKRLPTEAEWEIASRGGQESALYPTGQEIEKTQANFFSSDTTTVMSYAPNGFGLYDMAGNVYEWCHDWYGYNYYELSLQEPDNPQGPLQGVYRVLRGGCWKSLKEDLRCSRRHRNNPGTVNGTYGFRCATDVQIS
jgi:formylglycine-generating enzyme required for sulfatase activity